jgi:hypothetical protein
METTMGKHIDFSGALDLIKYGQELGKMKTPAPREKKEKEDKPVDILALMEQKRREYLALKNFVDEQAKLNKPYETNTNIS